MKQIYQRKFNTPIINGTIEHIRIERSGVYGIEISASAKSWWQNTVGRRSFLRKDSLTVRIDQTDITEQKGRLRVGDIWNGNILKGTDQTLHLFVFLSIGDHGVLFVSHGRPELVNLTVHELEGGVFELKELKSTIRDRTPWIVFLAFAATGFSSFSLTALADKTRTEDDDLGIRIDGRTIKNSERRAHKEWYWCGKILNGSTKTFDQEWSDSERPLRMDIFADGSPTIDRITLRIRRQSVVYSQKDIQKYTYRGSSGKQDYNRFDDEILDAVNAWNKEFDDEYPPPEPLHPNLIKAMIYVESKMGYYESPGYPSYPDVMQVADSNNPAIHTLNKDGWKSKKGVLAQESEWKNEHVQYLDYKGAANGTTPRASIVWGTRWLYHRVQGITDKKTRYWKSWKEAVAFYNGGGDPNYVNEVYDAYLRGIDSRDKKYPLKLFILTAVFLAVLSFSAFGVYAVLQPPNSYQTVDESPNIGHPEDVLRGIIPQNVRKIMHEKMKLYELQNSYYYGTLFKEAADLCHQHDSECDSDYIFSSYLDEIISKSRSIHAFQEVIEPFDLIDAHNSFYDDLDNDGESELAVVLMDPLNREYLTVFIVDQKDDFLHVVGARLERPYVNGTPRVIDLTNDGIPEIVVFSTGGRQDIQAYVFQYTRGELKKLLSIERGYLHARIIFTDQNGNHIPEIMVRGEQYGDECMACNHAPIEEVFEYDVGLKKIILLSSKRGPKKDDIERKSEN